jgi:hypothetical protein
MAVPQLAFYLFGTPRTEFDGEAVRVFSVVGAMTWFDPFEDKHQ